MRAAKGGLDKIVDILLEGGANPNLGNDWNQTPLMFAAMYGQEAIVHKLLAKGANVHAISKVVVVKMIGFFS